MKSKLFFFGVLFTFVPAYVLAHGDEGHMEAVAAARQGDQFFWITVILLISAGVAAGTFLVQRNAWRAVGASILTVFVGISLFMGTVYKKDEAFPLSISAPSEKYQILKGAMATVYKSPGCSCCGGYIVELERYGVQVTINEVSDAELFVFKERQGVAENLRSCHTTVMDGYVIEGHVPFEALEKLRTERPGIKGIALPGMPIGTPGMPGRKTQPYEVKTLTGEAYLTL